MWGNVFLFAQTLIQMTQKKKRPCKPWRSESGARNPPPPKVVKPRCKVPQTEMMGSVTSPSWRSSTSWKRSGTCPKLRSWSSCPLTAMRKRWSHPPSLPQRRVNLLQLLEVQPKKLLMLQQQKHLPNLPGLLVREQCLETDGCYFFQELHKLPNWHIEDDYTGVICHVSVTCCTTPPPNGKPRW